MTRSLIVAAMLLASVAGCVALVPDNCATLCERECRLGDDSSCDTAACVARKTSAGHCDPDDGAIPPDQQ